MNTNLVKAIDIYLWRDTNTFCETCNHTGKIKMKSESFPWFWYADCCCTADCYDVEVILEGIKKSWILPGAFKKYDIKKYDETQGMSRDFMEAFVDWKTLKPWLYVCWTVWAWKTYAAYNVLYETLWKGRTVFASWLETILENSRPGWEQFWVPQWYYFWQALQCDVLLLDDFWNEKLSDWMIGKTFALINHRSTNGMSTIFTANRMPKDTDICKEHKQLASRILWEAHVLNFSKNRDLRLDL